MNGYDETEAFGYGYPEDEEDENERDDRLTRVGVFMNMLPETAFSEALFENANAPYGERGSGQLFGGRDRRADE